MVLLFKVDAAANLPDFGLGLVVLVRLDLGFAFTVFSLFRGAEAEILLFLLDDLDFGLAASFPLEDLTEKCLKNKLD